MVPKNSGALTDKAAVLRKVLSRLTIRLNEGKPQFFFVV